jgi:hypothetical protein
VKKPASTSCYHLEKSPVRRHLAPIDLPAEEARFARAPSHEATRQERDAARLAALRSAIDEGEAFARARAHLGIRER